ncbi:MAG: hypothetical protein RLZZ24_975 [Pseudomonadota bacterium]
MTPESQFLSFKGLKQYNPDEGWSQVNAAMQARLDAIDQSARAKASASPDIPVLTESPESGEDKTAVFDPLISELFDQLKTAPNDELTQTWRTIAAEVNLLTQRMAMRRELQERMMQLDKDMMQLRHTIMLHLRDVGHAADQQLSSARLRSEVSALAQSKLTARLNSDI